MMLPEHEKYHKMPASEAHIKEKTIMHVSRSTAQTGEQFHAEIPIYPEDTREQIKDRTNFMLSIIQDRLEDENRAVNARNEEQQKINGAAMAIERNKKSFISKTKALAKQLQRKKISKEEHDAQVEV